MNTTPTVYGGYCYFPEHPNADMHGIVRFSVRASSPTDAIWQLGRYGILIGHTTLNKFWGPTKSTVEQEVCAGHHASVFFCSPTFAYTQTDFYRCDPSLMANNRKREEKKAHEDGAKVTASGRPKPRRKVELP